MCVIRSSDWDGFLDFHIEKYRLFHEYWLKNFTDNVHIVHYEDLVRNMKGVLQDVVMFLVGQPVNKQTMACALKHPEVKAKFSNLDQENFYNSYYHDQVLKAQQFMYHLQYQCVESGRCQRSRASMFA